MISPRSDAYGFSTGAGGYDNADRLVAWDRTDGNKNQSWTLSGTGDWSQFVDTGTTQTRTHNNVHEATTINSTGLSRAHKGAHKGGAQGAQRGHSTFGQCSRHTPCAVTSGESTSAGGKLRHTECAMALR